MNCIKSLLFISFFCFTAYQSNSQEKQLKLTLDEVIALAKEQSYDALIAKHTYLGSYWQYRTYRSGLLPNIDLSTNLLNYRNSIDVFTNEDGDNYFYQEQNSSDVNISVNQAVPFSGGSIFMQSNLGRLDNFLADSSQISPQFSSTPISVGFRQPLFSFNNLKWERKIEPVKYEEAKRKYIEALEQISLRAINNFFDLALAQINLEIAKVNFNNNDTLYKIANGRFNIGTIAKNELLQMELNFLNSRSELERAKLDLEIREFQLQSFLGYNELVNIELLIPQETPSAVVTYDKTISLAQQNNPSVLSFDRRLIEAEREVARAKSQNRFQADLYTSYGLTDQGDKVPEVYKELDNSLLINVGVSVPILDWGMGRGLVKIAKSNQEVINASVIQDKIEFEQNIYLKVREFNIQQTQFDIAAKADTIAMSKYEVTKQRFLIGKIDVLELNIALTEKDSKRRGYIAALRNYWRNYYTLRQLTQYNFIENKPLVADYEELVR
jgi:outer membrane protein TolC